MQTTSILLYSFISFIIGMSILVFLVNNPIHSLLNLIAVFFFGTCFLFFINIEYYALLFLIVYVGAIVVLFLFIIRILELKLTNSITLNKNFLWYSILLIFFSFFISIICLDTFSLNYFFSLNNDAIKLLNEANTNTNDINFLYYIDQLFVLGLILYTEFKFSVILASLLLFVVIVGVLILTLAAPQDFYYKNNNIKIKRQ
jgi:NADH:ubiquinone oxidoreductase subunit 6 (subunit J)